VSSKARKGVGRLHRAARALRGLDHQPPAPPSTAVGAIDWGALRTVTPISDDYGVDRGSPIDRYYIEGFLERHSQDIRGRVLEIHDGRYARRFGGDRVQRLDVLHAGPGNPEATIEADLTDAPQIPDGMFDCVICTQTLMFIYDVPAAIRTLERILAPGGAALVTVSCVSRICQPEMEIWGDWWRFTSKSARRLFEQSFPEESVQVESHGNVLAGVSMLYGIAAEELTESELDHADRNFEVLLAVRAQSS
jgi:SAM-dependent methyltransferase